MESIPVLVVHQPFLVNSLEFVLLRRNAFLDKILHLFLKLLNSLLCFPFLSVTDTLPVDSGLQRGIFLL